MAKAPSIGAIPTQVSAEMQQILIAMKRAIEAQQDAQDKIMTQLANIERRLTALE